MKLYLLMNKPASITMANTTAVMARVLKTVLFSANAVDFVIYK